MIISEKSVTKLIAYGILIFLVGFFLGSFWLSYFQWLIPVGSVMTFSGIYFFFKVVNLFKEFEFKTGDDFLTYFWNVLALKVWTLIFSLWMIGMNIILLSKGHI